MRAPPVRPCVTTVAAAVALAAALLCGPPPHLDATEPAGDPRPAAPGHGPGAVPAARDTLRGTLQGVYPGRSEVHVLTGVGLSLRTVRVRTLPETTVRGAGGEVRLDALRRGQVVVVVLREAPGDVEAEPGVRVAASVRVVGTSQRGGAP